VTGYSGDAGDAMTATQETSQAANGMMFTTLDSDNDILYNLGNCAVRRGSGWWFGKCSRSAINTVSDGMWSTGGRVFDVQASHMLVKLN